MLFSKAVFARCTAEWRYKHWWRNKIQLDLHRMTRSTAAVMLPIPSG